MKILLFIHIYYNSEISDGQVVSGTDGSVNGSSSTPDCSRFSVLCKIIALPVFYDDITGQTEFIISLVNSVKMVNIS